MEKINTSDGLFAAGNPQTGVPGTIVTAKWLNNVQTEICNVITGAGIHLDGADPAQLYGAIKSIIAEEFQGPVVVPTTPTVQGPQLIFVMDKLCYMTWVATAFYTGYRSLLCGHWWGGATQQPRAFEIDAQGDVYDIADYPSLWGYANENGLVVDAGDWEPKWIRYAQIGANQFRMPDLRDMFQRMSGTDADTANARELGSYQQDALQSITGSAGKVLGSGQSGAFYNQGDPGNTPSGTGGGVLLGFDASRVARTSVETRAASGAVAPYIHV